MDTQWMMKFEAFLSGEMDETAKAQFETELTSNKEMYEAFLIYSRVEAEMHQKIHTDKGIEALKINLKSLNRQYFSEENEAPVKVIPMTTSWNFRRAVAVAAGILLIFVFYFVFFLSGTNPQGMAEDYYVTNLKELSQTMNGSQDSIQRGIAAYNSQDFEEAKRYFEGLALQDPNNAEVIKNLGLTYLSEKKFDQALSQFETLSARNDLYSNPGLFLKALTLMMRNRAGDMDQAKVILEEVVEKGMEGKAQAQAWLKQIK